MAVDLGDCLFVLPTVRSIESADEWLAEAEALTLTFPTSSRILGLGVVQLYHELLMVGLKSSLAMATAKDIFSGNLSDDTVLFYKKDGIDAGLVNDPSAIALVKTNHYPYHPHHGNHQSV